MPVETRVQRIVVETPRFRIVGSVHLPTEGFRTRLSDVLNRDDTRFIAMIEVELQPTDGGEAQSLPFVAVSRSQILIAYEVSDNE
jgi:hypothetical protein